MPTGSGKSPVGVAIARWLNSAYILTESKQLQDQYKAEFTGLHNIKGKASYSCNRMPSVNVSDALCAGSVNLVSRCRGTMECSYYQARDKAMQSAVMLSNYAYFFTSYQSVTKRKRDAIICDEGHVLEHQLVNQITLDIDLDDLNEHLEFETDIVFPTDYDECLNTLVTLSKELTVKACELINKQYQFYKHALSSIDIESMDTKAMEIALEPDPWLLKEFKQMLEKAVGGLDFESAGRIQSPKLKWINRKVSKCDSLLNQLGFVTENLSDEWVIDNISSKHIKVTPFNAKRLFEDYMFSRAERIVIMSATLGSVPILIDELGLDPDDCMYIDTDSTFDSSKAPIYYMPGPSLSYKNYSSNIHETVQLLDTVLEMYPNEKGIVHTGNYRVLNDILKKSKYVSRFIAKTDDKMRNEDLIREHMKRSGPSVLISPSMHSGVDLKDDLARFQIIMKLPYASLKDARVNKKRETIHNWYENDVMTKVIQASGRAIRHDQDYADTYVLDTSFKRVYSALKDDLPSHFLDRIVWN